MKRTAGIAVVIAVTLATLTYSLWNIDVGALWRILRSVRLWVVVPFLAVLAFFYWSNAQRWSWTLAPFGRFSSSDLLPSMMIGFACNNVLPFRLGELVRVYLFSKEFNQPRSGVLMTLILERLLDLVGILFCFGIGLALVPDAPVALHTTGLFGTVVVASVCLMLLGFLMFERQVGSLWLRIAKALPKGIRVRGDSYLEECAKGLMSLRNPAKLLLLVFQSIGRWLLAAMLAWLSIYACGEIVSFPLAMVVLGVTAFAVSLPSAPGFVGPIQAAFVFALTPFGFAREAALAASIFFLLGHWIPVTAIGATLLTTRHFSIAQLRQAVVQEETEPP
jgi:glycosyltransferase 2 family protein